MFERFTDRARKVMQLANQEAQRFNHEYIGCEHILLGLVAEGSGVAANVLKNLDADLRKIRIEVERVVQHGAHGDQLILSRLPHTPRAKKVIEYAVQEAEALRHTYVGTEHLLLGLLREVENVAAQVLMNLGLKLDDVRAEVLNLLGHNPTRTDPPPPPMTRPKTSTPALDSFCLDFTDEARRGKYAVPAGRTADVERVLRTLLRQAGNPLIVGDREDVREVVEGVAHQAVRLSPRFHDVRLLELLPEKFDTGNSSQVAERATAMVNEAARASGVWLVVRSAFPFGRAFGVRDANKRFRLLVAAGRVRAIWSVTPEEQAELVTDVDLSLRLTPVVLGELPTAALADHLRPGRDRLEVFHKLHIPDDAVAEAARLGRTLSRATALLDDAAAAVRLRQPPLIDPEVTALDAEFDALTAAKEAAVVEQRFDEAAELRDRGDRIRKLRNEHLARMLHRRSSDSAVTPDDIRAVAGARFSGATTSPGPDFVVEPGT